MSEQPPLLRPRPQRVFDLSPGSAEPSEPSSPAEPANPDLLNPNAGTDSVSRTGSIMNLTSPTLYGIYSPTAFDSARDESSPWGTEAQTTNPETSPKSQAKPEPRPFALQRTRSRLNHGLFRGVILPPALRSALLFSFGVVYGLITVHLHENHWITPVKLENLDWYSWHYLGFWGLAGVLFGNVLPWLDLFYEEAVDMGKDSKRANHGNNDERTLSWNAAVRSVGAFVGIAFAMRRTPWQSTTQASLTLALVNPVLWYLIDRTKTGFLTSAVVGLSGMGLFIGLNPEVVPTSPATFTFLNGTGKEYFLVTGMTQESIAVRTWAASVLFCACVCFGNIGRQLALGGPRKPLKA